MQEYITIGPTPAEEDCAQVGSEDYQPRAMAECKRFISRIREVLGTEPDGARLAVKSFPHDFGSYFEVVCFYETDIPESLDYALKCEGESPTTWN